MDKHKEYFEKMVKYTHGKAEKFAGEIIGDLRKEHGASAAIISVQATGVDMIVGVVGSLLANGMTGEARTCVDGPLGELAFRFNRIGYQVKFTITEKD